MPGCHCFQCKEKKFNCFFKPGFEVRLDLDNEELNQVPDTENISSLPPEILGI